MVKDLSVTQTQLVQSEKLASLGQLTAGVAHEINNPINFVSGNITPLKRDIEEIMTLLDKYTSIDKNNFEQKFEEIIKYKDQIDLAYTIEEIKILIKGIEEGSKRTAEIVKGLRNFARPDDEKMRESNINDGINSTLLILHNKITQHDIEVTKTLGNLPEINCFPGQLNQVFLNLFTNAIDAMDGKGKLMIESFLENDQIKISVKDTGTGMSEEVKRKIFDPFFTTKEVGKGTGLGLSISYGIVEKHKGKITVNSEPGKGTEFIITLPVDHKSNA
jgi:signal transduction histidine kinase